MMITPAAALRLVRVGWDRFPQVETRGCRVSWLRHCGCLGCWRAVSFWFGPRPYGLRLTLFASIYFGSSRTGQLS